MKIIDISKYQKTVNYPLLDVDGVIARLGHGSMLGGRLDPYYATHINGARKAGHKHIGHYWFNGPLSGEREATYFVANLHGYKDGDSLILDIEGTYQYTVAKALQWVATVRKLIPGANVAVYMSSALAASSKWKPLVDAGVKLWVARYGLNDGKVNTKYKPSTGPWPTYSLWQYTSKGTVKGYTGNVDLSTGDGLWPSAPAPSKVTDSGSKTTVTVTTPPKIMVDGKFGPKSVKALQYLLKQTQDGVVSGQPKSTSKYHPALYSVAYVSKPKGSTLVRSIQSKVGVKIDGLFGPKTISALQRYVGIVRPNGKFDTTTAKAFQKHINERNAKSGGKF